MAGHTGDVLEPHPLRGHDVEGDDPPADPSAVEGDADDRSHADGPGVLSRHEVVELAALVGQGGNVDCDARHPLAGRRPVGEAQSPSADFIWSRREATSQVKPSSDRPKWPYAAV